MDTIKALATTGLVDVIILDSIAGLVPSQNMDEDFSFSPMAWQARFVNSSLPRLLPSLHNGTALICINQVRASMGPTALANMPGGKAQSFFAHFLLEVRRNGWIEESGEKVGFDMQVRLRKTKVGGQNWKAASVPFRVEGGIDILESFIREGIEQGLVIKAGSWYTYNDVRAQGMNGLKQVFIDKPELQEQLINAVS
jgi:recombination protein RecA